MNRWSRVAIVVVCLLSSLWAEEVAELQQKRDALKAEAARLSAQIAQVDSLAAKEKSRFLLLKERNEADVQRRTAEIADLENKIRASQQLLSSERGSQARHKAKAEEIRYRDQFLLKMQGEYCSKLEALVERSIPWEKETRLERIRSLRRDIEAKTATAEEAFSRLNALLAEESRFGDEIALLQSPLARQDGEMVNATLLRLGNQTMAYMDDQEKRFGLLDRVVLEGGGWEWSWREELSFAERDAVRRALEVKGNRRPPELVVLPIGLSLSGPIEPPALSKKGGAR